MILGAESYWSSARKWDSIDLSCCSHRLQDQKSPDMHLKDGKHKNWPRVTDPGNSSGEW